MMGSSVGSFGGMNDGTPMGSLLENFFNKIPDEDMGESGRGP